MIKLQRQGIRWEVQPDCRELIDRLLADPGETVKKTPTKLVTVHRLGSQTFYVKRYQNMTKPLRRLKYAVKVSKAKHEWRLAQKFDALAIPLVRHIACGERWSATGLQESILVTEGFPGDELSNSTVHQLPEVQVALAGFLHHMHDQGVLQRDLHHNILVRINPVELRRVDLGNATIKKVITSEERIENLAWFNVNVTLSDAFFQAYGATDDFVRATRERSQVLRRESREDNSRRCFGDNLYFKPIRQGGTTWWVRQKFYNETLKKVLAAPDHATEEFLVTKFPARSLNPPARQAYRTAYHMELLGLPTLEVAAANTRYLITVRPPGTISLAEYLARNTPLDSTLIPRLAALLAMLHNEGFTSNGQLSETNFQVTPDGQILVLPLDQFQYKSPVSKRDSHADFRELKRLLDNDSRIQASALQTFLKDYEVTRQSIDR